MGVSPKDLWGTLLWPPTLGSWLDNYGYGVRTHIIGIVIFAIMSVITFLLFLDFMAGDDGLIAQLLS